MKSSLRFLIFLVIVILCVTTLYFWQRSVMYSKLALSGDVTPVTPVAVSAALPSTSEVSLAALDSETTQLIARVMPSVVSIQAVSNQKQIVSRPGLPFFGENDNDAQGQMGSGVIVSKNGYIITNLHVVEGGDSIDVILHDGRHYPATLAGSYPQADIAILKIDAEDLQPIPIADSEEVKVGQMVFAIGNPYGLQESVSHGIISAKGRRSPDESSINEFFQTNATLNPGNSGGPLVNIRGELIGINNFIFSQSGGWQGIGFVIPSNNARRIFDDIVSKGRVVFPYLGARSQWQKIPAQFLPKLKLPDSNGVLVTDVMKSSPAEIAGIRPGDVIRKFNNKPITDFTDLRNRIAETPPGQNVAVEIFRDGSAHTLDIQIKEQPDKAHLAYFPVHPPGQRTPVDGMVVYDLVALLKDRGNVDRNSKGVLVAGFQNAAPAIRYLKPGDVILQVGDMPVASLEAFREIVKKLPFNTPQQFLIQRNNLQGWVQIDPS